MVQTKGAMHLGRWPVSVLYQYLQHPVVLAVQAIVEQKKGEYRVGGFAPMRSIASEAIGTSIIDRSLCGMRST